MELHIFFSVQCTLYGQDKVERLFSDIDVVQSPFTRGVVAYINLSKSYYYLKNFFNHGFFKHYKMLSLMSFLGAVAFLLSGPPPHIPG